MLDRALERSPRRSSALPRWQIDDAISKIQASIQAGRTADIQALEQMKALAVQMKGTYEAAEEAWDNYRNRFSEVDKSLAVAAEKNVVHAWGQPFRSFRPSRRRRTATLADAVSKLSKRHVAHRGLCGGAERLCGAASAKVREPAE